MSIVIFDTEYTSWKGCLEHGWIGNQKKEVVQISAVKVSEDLKVLEEFNALCKPKINPVLSEYFINLTHITNEQLDAYGEPFADSYKKFEAFVGDDVCYSHAWGSDFLNKSDGDILEENLLLHNMSTQKKIKYLNIAPIFKQLYIKHKISVQSQSSGEIASILGVEQNLKRLNLNTHNAFYDVYSILEGLRYFYPESMEILKKFLQN